MTELDRTADVAAVLAVWTQARAHGWTVTCDPQRSGWRAAAPDNTAGFSYAPPDELLAGAVAAHDADRTLSRTGVTTATEAVGLLREFLGWPA